MMKFLIPFLAIAIVSVYGEGYPAWLGMVPKNGWPTSTPQPASPPSNPGQNPGQNGFVTNHPPANSYICFPFNGNVNGNGNGNVNGNGNGNGNSNGNNGQPGNGNGINQSNPGQV